MNPRAKKWLKFTLRWGIAAFGIWYVVAKISLHDRVMVADSNGWPQSLPLAAPAAAGARTFTAYDESGALRTIAIGELLAKSDRPPVRLRGRPDQLYDVLAVHVVDGADRDQWPLIVVPHRTLWQKITGDRSPRAMEVPAASLDGAAGEDVGYPAVEIGVLHMLRDARPWLLLAALLVLPGSFIITSIRWHELLRGLEIHIGLARVFTLNMVGNFYNTFMPGNTGGDLLKAYYASKQTPYRMRAVMSVIVDRVLGLLALIIFGGAMAASQWEVPVCRKIALAAAALLAATATGLFVFYHPAMRRRTGLDFVLKRLPLQKHVSDAVEVMDIYGKRPGLVAMAVLMTLPVHACSVTSAMFAGWAFGLPLSAAYYWAIVPVIVLSGAIPISPQGVGVMEGTGVVLMRSHGCTVGQVVALTMCIRLGGIFWNLIGGIFVIRGGFHVPPAGVMEQPSVALIPMLRKVDRLLLRVPNVASAVRYYHEVLGLEVIRQDPRLASLRLLDGDAELVLHSDDDLAAEEFYYLVDDVREMYRRRQELKLQFVSAPAQVSRGYRAVARDPFGNVLRLLDRSTQAAGASSIEDAKTPGALFEGVEARLPTRRDLLVRIYVKVGRTADDLPYTPHFQTLYADYAAAHGEPKPTPAEVWRQLLNLRKGRKLPKLGEARSNPPEIGPDDRAVLRRLLGDDIGRRDRLPYTDRFERLVDEFNGTQARPLSPHLVWRLVATLAK